MLTRLALLTPRRVPAAVTTAMLTRALGVARNLTMTAKQAAANIPVGKDPGSYDPQGHLRSDHLEYLDRQIEQTVNVLEENLGNLKETYQQKREHLERYTQLDPAMWPLLDQALHQKMEMNANLQALKQQLQELRAARTRFAVEAPDGESDGHVLEEYTQVEQILENIGKPVEPPPALGHEFAVDGPDGQSDGTALEQEFQARQTIQDMGKPPVHFKEFAVDAPDGESDAQVLRDEADAQDQINEMSQTENTRKVMERHEKEKQVLKERARDPEHDW